MLFINDEQTPITDITQITPQNNIKFFYVCVQCGKTKQKRYYKAAENDLLCRECKYQNTKDSKYNGQNPGLVKMKERMLEKYGTTSTAQFIDYSKIDYKTRTEKTKKTCLERYGVENPAQADKIKQKRKATNLERYGFESASKNEDVKNKQRETLKKYGILPGPAACKKKFAEYQNSKLDEDVEWLDKEDFHGKYDGKPVYYRFLCKKCGNEFLDDFHFGKPTCKVCYPNHVVSRPEKEVVQFIKENYSGTVVENDRTVLNGKELDIWLPEIKTAIEFNGTYWHGFRKQCELNEFLKKNNYKQKQCHKLGIHLITIYEAEFDLNKERWLAFIKDQICPRIRLFARDCEIREIETAQAKTFCEKYHVHGYRNGSKKFGLLYDDELVCVAVFGKHKKYQNECMRLCYKTGISIIGGWEKIIKHFGEQFLHYVNLSLFDGENKTGSGYKLWFRHKLFSRQQLMKSNLHNYFEVMENISAFDQVLNNGGIAIFDVGNDIRIYNTNCL